LKKGGSHAEWRVDLTLNSKAHLLKKLKQHCIAELRSAKSHFIAEHELMLSYCDYTVDSAGVFLLIILYDYKESNWFLMLYVEATIYVIVGSFLNVYASWINRNIVFVLIILFFGVLTYFRNPHTEDFDKWFDFFARSLVVFFSLITILCAKLVPFAANKEATSLYNPKKSSAYFKTYGSGLSAYQFFDLVLVLFFYAFVVTLLYYIGFFSFLQRKIKSLKHSMHDRVFDFLIEKLEQKCIGLENIYIGFNFYMYFNCSFLFIVLHLIY
jgi:hypothetical protein